jgi:DUF2892 family protein
MTRNVGGFERIALFIIAAIILGLYGALTPPWRYIALIGLIPLASALTGFCPIYVQLGWNRRAPSGRRGEA